MTNAHIQVDLVLVPLSCRTASCRVNATKLLGISKHGDVYLRTLLIHGARSVLRHLKQRPAHTDSWLARLVARRNRNVAAVALANKNARIAWALLAHQRDFDPEYVSIAPTR